MAARFVGEVRERSELDDATRQKEREDLVLAVDALVGGSLRPTVSFGRLQRHLSWKTQQLSDVLEYCGQAGLLRIEGEPRPLSHRGTHAGLTPAGASLAEWIRAGRPENEACATYTFNAPVTDSNFAYGCSGEVRQVTGGGRIDALECARLIEAVRDEPRPEALPIRSHAGGTPSIGRDRRSPSEGRAKPRSPSYACGRPPRRLPWRNR
jgi:hypothetical protein